MKKKEIHNHFKTPEGYFEGFTTKLLGKLSEEVPNRTKSNVHEGGFSIPECYFENINEKISTKLNSTEIKVVRLYPFRKYYIAAASIAAMLIFIFGIDWNPTNELTFDNLASSDIEKYFETNDLDLTTLEIAEVFPIDEMAIGDILNNQLNEENIIDYLNNNIESFEEFNLEADE